MSNRIDSAMAEQILQGDDTDPDILQSLGLELLAELKRCYYEIDLLQEYAKCVECGGQYIGTVDYGLHEWDHSKDCEYASE